MKSRLVLIFIGMIACASCRKSEDAAPSGDLPANTWMYNAITLNPAYSELNTKSGYLIQFYPDGARALTTSISFLFKARPQPDDIYKPAQDTSAANLVRINLKTGTAPGYTSAGNDVSIRAAFTGGKLQLTGNGIRMVRDTTAALADTTILSFNLTEF